MMPTTFSEVGHALQLVDEEGRPIGNQLAVRLEQTTENSMVTITFAFDGRWVKWWQGLPPEDTAGGW